MRFPFAHMLQNANIDELMAPGVCSKSGFKGSIKSGQKVGGVTSQHCEVPRFVISGGLPSAECHKTAVNAKQGTESDHWRHGHVDFGLSEWRLARRDVPNGQHRTPGVPDDMLGDAAQNQV